MDESAAGPGIGPSIVPPPMDGGMSSAPPHMQMSMGPGIISSAPQPASHGMQPSMGMPMSMQSTPVPLPTLHYQGLNAPQPFGYQPPAPPAGMPMNMMHPSRMAAMGGPPPGMFGPGGPGVPGQLAGTIRSADEMNGEDGSESNEQLAKRQRVQKLPGGHLYPEQNWIDMHPVSAIIILTGSLLKPPITASHQSPNSTTHGHHQA